MRGMAGEPLVDVPWIAAHLTDPGVRLVEVDVSPASYNEGHIPGAILWNAYADLRDASYAQIGREALGSLLSRSGITAGTTVVFYGYGAPLGYWLLRTYGHADVRLLMGLRDRWAAEGHPWSTDSPAVAPAPQLSLSEDSTLVASRHEVEAAMETGAEVLLDVRAEAEYVGERFWPSGATVDAGRAGHVPGAVNVPIDLIRAGDGTLKPTAELRTIFDAAGVTGDKPVIVYCTIGNRASEAWFALTQLLGHSGVRVYYGSWVEWGKADATPVVAGAGAG
jgi:thiosulfate/3-mercaptopyruvate sulfurtransferase